MGLLNKIETGTYRKSSEGKPAQKQGEEGLTKIESDIDKLYRNIQSSKTIKLNSLAKLMGVSEEKAEELVKILSEKEMAAISYPLIGKAVISANLSKKKEGHDNRKWNLILFTIVISL